MSDYGTSTGLTPADLGAIMGGGNRGFGSWGGISDLIALIIVAGLFGGGFGGWGGGFGGGANGAAANYVLSSDFATIQRQLSDGFNSTDNALDRQNAGICDLGYAIQGQFGTTNMAIMQGNNALAAQLADCCCKTQSGIAGVNTAIAMADGNIRAAIKDCCCDAEKTAMQARFDAAQYNCATMAAIDKVGDRIIDYMAADKAQALRDENQALRLAASQAAQNNYLISQLRPMPIPAYPSCNPWAASYGYGFGGGCCNG